MKAKNLKQVTVENCRNMCFGEILIIIPTGLEVYSTTELSDCPVELRDSLVVLGYGGRCYFPTNIGYLTLQAVPAEKTA